MLYYIGFEGPEELGGGRGARGHEWDFRPILNLMECRLMKIEKITKKLNQSEEYNPKRIITYSLMNMRKIHIYFNQAKKWQIIVCLLMYFLFFPRSNLNLPVVHRKFVWYFFGTKGKSR